MAQTSAEKLQGELIMNTTDELLQKWLVEDDSLPVWVNELNSVFNEHVPEPDLSDDEPELSEDEITALEYEAFCDYRDNAS